MKRIAKRIDRPHDPAEQCRLLLIGARPLLCEGLQALFCQTQGWRHVHTAVGVAQGIGQAGDFLPHVALIDLKLPDGGALAAARAIRSPGTSRLVFLDDTFHEGRLRAVLSLRAAGYFTQDDSFETLLDGVQRVAFGGSAFSPAAEPHLVHVYGRSHWKAPAGNAGPVRLTRRELEILVLVAQGLSVRECAEELHVAPSTADNHKSRLMAKLGVHKVVDLVHVAIREGLLERPITPGNEAHLPHHEG